MAVTHVEEGRESAREGEGLMQLSKTARTMARREIGRSRREQKEIRRDTGDEGRTSETGEWKKDRRVACIWW